MKLFLDTADLQAIKQWSKTGILDGVTTNPTLMSKAGGDPSEGVQEIARMMGAGDVSVEVTTTDPADVYQQAKRIAALADNIVVKIPCHTSYYAVIKQLVSEGVQINVTLVFSVMQGLAMNKLGAKYISPFIGRLDDINQDGIGLVQQLCMMRDQYAFKTQVLAASIRNREHLNQVILCAADVATVPVTLLEESLQHDLTDKGMERFLDDWAKLGVQQFP